MEMKINLPVRGDYELPLKVSYELSAEPLAAHVPDDVRVFPVVPPQLRGDGAVVHEARHAVKTRV